MDAKARALLAKPGAVPSRSATRRSRVAVETSRLFLDVEEIIRRSQTQRLSRYVE